MSTASRCSELRAIDSFSGSRCLRSLFFSLSCQHSHCMETACYLRDQITEVAGMSCRLNDLSSTVVLERPMDDDFVKRWQLACEEDIAHVVVMPNVTRQKIDHFVKELMEQRDKYGRRKPHREDSPLSKLGSSTWGGSYVNPIINYKKDA